MNISVYIIPVLILALFIYARFRGVKIYESFTDGVKGAVGLALSLFPYLATIFIILLKKLEKIILSIQRLMTGKSTAM